MKKLSPAVRLSLSLVMLTLSMLLIAEMLGLAPNRINDLTESRAKVTENLAVQLAIAASRNDRALLSHTLKEFVGRNEDVLSGGVRGDDVL